mgnify:CR=1 FL=1
MEMAQATKKITEGHSRLKPSDLSSAAAHTASKAPEKINTNHDMASPFWPSCRITGHGSLVRDPRESRRARPQ